MGGRRDCRLLRQKVDQRRAYGQAAHTRAQCMGSIGLKKQLATQLGNCYSSGNTMLDRYVDGHSDKIFDACVCWQKPSKQPTICSSTH
eukprot:12897790-Ditylum_brightwellii.AAC.1